MGGTLTACCFGWGEGLGGAEPGVRGAGRRRHGTGDGSRPASQPGELAVMEVGERGAGGYAGLDAGDMGQGTDPDPRPSPESWR